jgi:hypothetical protein
VRAQVPKERSLAFLHPELAAELHPTRNPALDPHTLGASSMKNVWWRCSGCGHEWHAIVANRARGTGCPSCWRNRRRLYRGTRVS